MPHYVANPLPIANWGGWGGGHKCGVLCDFFFQWMNRLLWVIIVSGIMNLLSPNFCLCDAHKFQELGGNEIHESKGQSLAGAAITKPLVSDPESSKQQQNFIKGSAM